MRRTKFFLKNLEKNFVITWSIWTHKNKTIFRNPNVQQADIINPGLIFSMI